MPAPRVDVTLTWPTARPPRQQPASVRVIQREFAHDMLVLTYYFEPHAVQRYKEGTPLSVQWGVLPQETDTFYGTVLYIRPHMENDRHTLRVICIGTSYPFKDSQPRVYNDASVGQVVSAEVRRERLSLVRGTSSVSWPLLVRHTDETGWEFLTRMAKRVGYTWFVNKSTVHCYDPLQPLMANLHSHPVLTYKLGRGGDFEGDVVTFTPEIGDQGVPHQESRVRKLLTVDPRSQQIIGASSDGSTLTTLADVKVAPKFAAYVDHPANSMGEAIARVAGVEAAQRWTHRARCRVHGNARLRQGTGVFIEGVSDESDGLWYVHAATHEITREERPYWRYYTDLELVRDSHALDYRPKGHKRAVRPSVARDGIESNPKPPRTIWTGSRWVSAHPQELVLP